MKVKYAIFLFAFLSPLLVLLQAIVKAPVSIRGFLIPAGHLVELVGTFTAITFSYSLVVFSYLRKINKTSFLVFLALAFSFALLGINALGIGVHFASNSLHHFVITNKISGEINEIAFLYNEVLSHLIWIPSLILFPLSIAVWGKISEKVLEKGSLLIWLPGLWYGLTIGLAVLEAQVVKKIGLPLALLSLGSLFLGKVKPQKWFSNPGYVFALSSYVVMLASFTLWYLRFRGFPEPLNILF